jgi:putative PIN family toxin of toxin-antitoxin system
MIYVQAAARVKNPANACLKLVEAGIVRLYLSRETIAEIEDVLSRTHLRNRFETLTDEKVEAFLADIKSKAQILKNVPSVFQYPRDPKDEKYINLALEVEADYLVSRDKDLLDLMTDISADAKEFRQKSRPLKIVEPIGFLKILAEKELSLNE